VVGGGRDLRVYLHTLGCPKNDADSRSLARRLRAQGARMVDEPDQATDLLLNTCGFIQDAKEESIAAILSAAGDYPGRRLLVMGCLVQRYRDELRAEIPEVDDWFSLGEVDRLVRALSGPGRGAAEGLDTGTLAVPAGLDTPGVDRSGAALPYAYVKVSDGCDHRCSFCAIPAIKGPYQARSLSEVRVEAEAALAEGARELVLVGQDTAIWRDGGQDLADLLELLGTDKRVLWLRLLYLQPEHVQNRLLSLMAEHPKVCRYLDIPLQHVSRSVLAAMGREGDGDAYRRLVERARVMMPDISLRSTFMVGFPGETEADFDELLRFAEEVGFNHAGVFLYSPEEGTRAERLPGPVPEAVARERLQRLSATLADASEVVNHGLVGRETTFLLEALGQMELPGDVVAMGRTAGQAPEIDGVAFVEGALPAGSGPGEVFPVRITEALGHDLVVRWDGS